MENGCAWSAGTCRAAAQGGLACLKYVHERGCVWAEETCSAAALFGKLQCLRYSSSNHFSPSDSPLFSPSHPPSFSSRYAHEQGCKWGEQTCEHAAQSGSLDCLTYVSLPSSFSSPS